MVKEVSKTDAGGMNSILFFRSRLIAQENTFWGGRKGGSGLIPYTVIISSCPINPFICCSGIKMCN